MQQNIDPSFVLSGSTLLAVGGVLGSLAGAITFLFRALIKSKDDQIADLKEQVKTLLPSLERLTTAVERMEDARHVLRAQDRDRR